MNSYDLRNLQEAYMDVYNDLSEGRKETPVERIKGQIDRKEKDLSQRPLSQLTPAEEKRIIDQIKKLKQQLPSPPAKVLHYPQRMKEAQDYYDLILSHLLDEGYAETIESAEVMMVNMSEEWRESICEGLGGMRRYLDYDEYNHEAREEMKQALSRLKKRLGRETKSQEAQKFLTKHPKKTK